MIRYILLWFPMLLIAVANGTGREWYKQYTGETAGRQISTFTLIIFFGFYFWWVIRKYPPVSSRNAIIAGLIWLVLTLLFEFGFGLYRGNSLSALLGEYNIFKGRLWILIPIWVATAPYLFYKLK